jgi:threo-3-hydroxy-L-aspartate ammonia-lyase
MVGALFFVIKWWLVEPETANDTQLSFKQGNIVEIPPPVTIADGARVQSPGLLTFPIIKQNAEEVLTVTDEELVQTLKFLLLRLKILVEPTGALAAAALLFDKLPGDCKKVGVILSGGNIDPFSLAAILARPHK